jgi:hypothetical protein
MIHSAGSVGITVNVKVSGAMAVGLAASRRAGRANSYCTGGSVVPSELVKTARLAVSLRTLATLGEGQKSESAGHDARGRIGLG